MAPEKPNVYHKLIFYRLHTLNANGVHETGQESQNYKILGTCMPVPIECLVYITDKHCISDM